MLNSVTLVGRMAGDAELRYVNESMAVATFRLAVNRNFKGQDGKREADFINCVIWRQQAENFAHPGTRGGTTRGGRRARCDAARQLAGARAD